MSTQGDQTGHTGETGEQAAVLREPVALKPLLHVLDGC